jgi:hypothetical protein
MAYNLWRPSLQRKGGNEMGMFETWINALKMPADTFRKETNKGGIADGAKNLLIAGLIAGFITGIGIFLIPGVADVLSLLGGFGAGIGAMAFIAALIGMPIMLIIQWFIIGIIYYIFAKIFGGKGTYTNQIYLMALYMAPIAIIQAILALIYVPVGSFTVGAILGWIVSLYALYPLTMALKEAHAYDTMKAVATWLVPLVIILVLALTMFASMMQFVI